MAKTKEDIRPLGPPRSWASSYGTQLAGQAAIDGADAMAIAMEQKWGAGRLRLLVDTELREKFDKQRFLFNAAIWHGDLEAVRRESERMVKAWRALDGAAETAGASKLHRLVWEVVLPDGTVAALVRGGEEAHALATCEGRQMVVYTLAEIGTMLGNYREVVQVKEAIPGSTVEAIRRTINDPLDGFRDGVALEDTLDDPTPHFGN